MVNSSINIYFKEVTLDNEGNPSNSSSSISIFGHIEKKLISRKENDAGNTNKNNLTIRVTDAYSIILLKNQTNNPDYLIYEGEKYSIADIRKYYTYIEIITEW